MTLSHSFKGQILLAMPHLQGHFERAVIYLCSHDDKGAMGLMINQNITHIDFQQLLEQLDIKTSASKNKSLDIPIHQGGPVEPGRGFVLHSADYAHETTLIISETTALTATIDILKAIAENKGPKNHLIALGYAGWGPGQLEEEIQQNSWLTAEADDRILFDTLPEQKWPRAMAMLGIDTMMLVADAGHA